MTVDGVQYVMMTYHGVKNSQTKLRELPLEDAAISANVSLAKILAKLIRLVSSIRFVQFSLVYSPYFVGQSRLAKENHTAWRPQCSKHWYNKKINLQGNHRWNWPTTQVGPARLHQEVSPEGESWRVLARTHVAAIFEW